MKNSQIKCEVLSVSYVLCATITIASITACSTTQSALDGKPFTRVDPKLLPVTVTKVDGESRSGNPVWVEPGTRSVTLSAAPALGGRFTVDRTFTVEVGACERVVFGARREVLLRDAFEPVVVEREPIRGCSIAKK
jgi:hypothetical protein